MVEDAENHPESSSAGSGAATEAPEPLRVTRSVRSNPSSDAHRPSPVPAVAEKSLWFSPTGLVIYTATIMIVVTIFLSAWKIRQRRAEAAFEQLVVRAEAEPDPRTAVMRYEQYIANHPDNSITHRARSKLVEAQERIAGYDCDAAIASAEAQGDRYEVAQQILQAYLDTDPPAPYRERVERKLAELPSLREARDFRLLQEEYPEDSADPAERRVAIEDFIHSYPQGPHREDAEKALLRITDALDEKACTEVKQQAQALRSAMRFDEALSFIESEIDSIASPKRQASLRQLHQDIQADRGAAQATEILALPTDSTIERDHAISESTLFLLGNPEHDQASRVQGFLDRLLDRKCQEEWARLQKDLEKTALDPARRISLLDRFRRRWPQWDSEQVTNLIATNRMTLFKQIAADLEVVERGTLVKDDGSKVTGRLEKGALDAWQITDHATGKTTTVYPSEGIKGIHLDPGPGDYEYLLSDIQTLDPQHPDPDAVASIIRTTERNGLTRLSMLAHDALLAIDPNNVPSKQTLEAAGYQYIHGRWIHLGSMTPADRIETLYEFYRDHILKRTSDTVDRLGLYLTYRQLGQEHDIAVACSANYRNYRVIESSSDGHDMKATLRLEFSVNLSQRDRTLSKDLSKTIVNSLRSKAQRLMCVVDLTLEERLYNRIGAEIMKGTDGRWSLKSLAAGGPAEQAWLEVDDELLAVNDVPLDAALTVKEVEEQIEECSSATCNLKMKRRGKVFSVDIHPEDPGTTIVSARYRIRHNIGQDNSVHAGEWVDVPSIEW